MEMTEVARDNILSSGPARFQLLTAFHPTITSRPVEKFSRKLSTSFPRPLFEVMVTLEVVIAHQNKLSHDDPLVKVTTDRIQRFCKSLANIYQVIFYYFYSVFHHTGLSLFTPLNPIFLKLNEKGDGKGTPNFYKKLENANHQAKNANRLYHLTHYFLAI
jgi:hypothetical protein